MSRSPAVPAIERAVLWVALVQAIVLSILAFVLPTWQDEEFTLATTAHGILYAIHRALTYELQAPFYFAVVAALRKIEGSVFVAREFSVAAQVAATFAIAAIARRIWPERNPWILCALVASNPFAIFAALEIRTYALAIFENAALFAFFFEGFLFGSDRRARIGYFACAMIGLYTQYFIAFDMLAAFVALAAVRRFAALWSFSLISAAAVVVFSPLALVLRSQASETLSVESLLPGGFGGMFLHPVDYPLLHDYTILGNTWSAILSVGVKVAVVGAIVVGLPRLNRRLIAPAAIFGSVALIYAILVDVEKLHLVVPRHFLALFLPEAIVAYALVANFRGRWALRCAATIAIALAVSNAVTAASTYRAFAKLGDAARVGAYLTPRAGPRDIIAVYPGDGAPAIARYYRGAARIVGYPKSLDLRVYQVDAALVASDRDAEVAFAGLPRAPHIWLLMLGTCDALDIHGCLRVQRVMAQRFAIRSKRDFFKATLYELAARTP